jgi:YesN/AraC family two-component response regulator
MYKLLIVDDSEHCRKPYREVARDDEGNPFLEIAEAETGEAGLAYFKEHSDILYAVVDIHLPGISGFGMLQKMNEFDSERLSKIQVFMTCTEAYDYADADVIDSSFASASLMVKPIDTTGFGKYLLADYESLKEALG